MTKTYLKVVMAVLVFGLVQGVGGIMAMIIEQGPSALMNYSNATMPDTTTLALTVVITNLVTTLILTAMGMIRPIECFRRASIRRGMVWPAVAAMVTGVFGLGLLSERLDLPNLMIDQFMDMAHNVWGILAVAVLGPVFEEIIFREGILGSMRRTGVGPWTAILVSSLCFGLIHLNPAQVPFAAAIGILLGIVYVKSGGSILLCSLLHILNNSVSIAEMNIIGEDFKTFTYTQALGGPVVASVLMVVSLVLCAYLAARLWRQQ